jgi:hypothetical protein
MVQTNSLGAWRRQPVLTVVLLLLVLVGTAVAVVRMPRTYQADGSVVLLASPAVANGTGNNPYLSFSGSLTLTADVLSRQLMAPGVVRDLASRGFADPYTVSLATYTTSTTGSVLTATVTGTDRAGVELELGAVMNEMQARLASLQSALKPHDRIRMATIAKSQWAAVSISQTARPLTLVVAVGLLLVIGLPWLVDARAARLQPRRASSADPEPEFGDPVAGAERGWLAVNSEPRDTRITRISQANRPPGPARAGQLAPAECRGGYPEGATSAERPWAGGGRPSCVRASRHPAPAHPRIRKVSPAAIANEKASNVANAAAAAATAAARLCSRSRSLVSATWRLARLTTDHPVISSAARASSPAMPVSISVVRYWSSTKK